MVPPTQLGRIKKRLRLNEKRLSLNDSRRRRQFLKVFITYQSNRLSREYGKGNVLENFLPAKGKKCVKTSSNYLKLKIIKCLLS